MADAGWVSEELREELEKLTAQQTRGVLRIVQAELEGRTLSSLLDCPGQICTSTTYYGSGRSRGWRNIPEFQKALELARRDYRAWLLQHGTEDALLLLSESAPHAVRALRQQVIGDEDASRALEAVLEDDDPQIRIEAASRLAATGQPRVVAALERALVREDDAQVRKALVEALGRIAGWRDGEQRLAANSILDRAGVETASKQTVAVDDDDLIDQIERELARLAGGSQAGVSGAAEGDRDTRTAR